MDINISIGEKLERGVAFAVLADGGKPFTSQLLTAGERRYLAAARAASPKKNFFVVPRIGQLTVVAFTSGDEGPEVVAESCRRAGSKLSDLLHDHKVDKLFITGVKAPFVHLTALAEGIVLASYRFLKYFTGENLQSRQHPLKDVILVHPKPVPGVLATVEAGIKYTCLARDLVNEPATALTAREMAELIATHAGKLSIKTEILNKGKIEALKMGGLLAVNRGSTDPPVFTILEYAPAFAVNARPVVLVGKGLIFDTGGMNLKTGSFMDGMKSDMAGAATMAGAIMGIAALKVPLHVIALIPSTDNRVDGKPLVPGDVITMHNGTTVEVNNTDAEGRLILADALSYAKRYDPMLAVDAATLTGAAARAIGPYGIVAMHKDAPEYMNTLKEAGEKEYERIAEFPMWKEYDELLKSDIADLSNIGGINGGAITAAKFLAHFTSFPFIHLDIAGPALAEKREHYIPKGGSGTGVRLLIRFLLMITEKHK
jgi:leucyl aminopeptidase